MPLHVSSTCAHHQEVKIALHSLWYHHTYRWPSCAQVDTVHETATYMCDDTRGCVKQFWPPDDEHMCSKHVEAWNKLILKQKFRASSWLITEINILRCTVSKTSKLPLIATCLSNKSPSSGRHITHRAQNGLSTSFNRDFFINVLATFLFTAAFIFSTCTCGNCCTVSLYYLYRNLPEDGDISLQHVESLCLWLTYNFIVCTCWSALCPSNVQSSPLKMVA